MLNVKFHVTGNWKASWTELNGQVRSAESGVEVLIFLDSKHEKLNINTYTLS